LRTSFASGDFFFAHAGVRPGVELSRQKQNDLLWIREEFLSSTDDFGKIIVHGHTPNQEIEVGPNRINIDTGAFATGRLTCLVIEEGSLSAIDTSVDA
jgi:serine/threonine protein phosphatase 1